MKPKQVTVFETSSGTTVKTLDEWKMEELNALVGKLNPDASFASSIIEHADAIAEILAVKPKGRPLNRKDSKPRAKSAAKTEAA